MSFCFTCHSLDNFDQSPTCYCGEYCAWPSFYWYTSTALAQAGVKSRRSTFPTQNKGFAVCVVLTGSQELNLQRTRIVTSCHYSANDVAVILLALVCRAKNDDALYCHVCNYARMTNFEHPRPAMYFIIIYIYIYILYWYISAASTSFFIPLCTSFYAMFATVGRNHQESAVPHSGVEPLGRHEIPLRGWWSSSLASTTCKI